MSIRHNFLFPDSRIHINSILLILYMWPSKILQNAIGHELQIKLQFLNGLRILGKYACYFAKEISEDRRNYR